MTRRDFLSFRGVLLAAATATIAMGKEDRVVVAENLIINGKNSLVRVAPGTVINGNVTLNGGNCTLANTEIRGGSLK